LRLLKNIFGRLWALWGLLAFAATLLVVILPICPTFLIPEPAGTEAFRRISAAWMTVF